MSSKKDKLTKKLVTSSAKKKKPLETPKTKEINKKPSPKKKEVKYEKIQKKVMDANQKKVTAKLKKESLSKEEVNKKKNTKANITESQRITPKNDKEKRKISKKKEEKLKEQNTSIKKKEEKKIKNKENLSTKKKKSTNQKVKNIEKKIKIEKNNNDNKTKKVKKIIITLLIFTIVIGGIILGIKWYQKSLNKYDSYTIGTKVQLKDNSTWYVISDTDAKTETVILLAEKPLDLNKDKKYDNNDKKEFSTDGSLELDNVNEENLGYYLSYVYKKTLTGLQEIKLIRLMTSEEYVDVRQALEFGYEWEEENFLAGQSLGKWWISSSKNKKILVVSEKGSYILSPTDSKYFIRPVIEITKSNIKESTPYKKEMKEEK